jgi:hypothetical protein
MNPESNDAEPAGASGQRRTRAGPTASGRIAMVAVLAITLSTIAVIYVLVSAMR